jgi:hypothetical protein
VDAATGTNTFMGYYVYRTQDPLYLDWGEPVDTLLRQHPVNNPDPPYFDGETGMYSWTDSGLINNFFYAYSVTGFDSSGTESGIANLDAETNALEVRPTSAPRQVGRLSDIRVVPNPFVISAQWERKRLASLPRLGEPRRELAFTNLPENATIRIYTVDGDHVDTIHHGGARGTAYWDLRNEADQLVTTGVYFYHVESGAEEHIGKFAVIR